MQIEHLREFIALSKTLNFNKTAKELHVSQPTLSNHVMAMESEIGVELISRGTDPSLTESGRAFLGSAKRVIDVFEKGVQDAKDALNANSKSINVGVMPYIPCPSIVRETLTCVREFCDLHNDATINIVPVPMEDVPAALRSGKVDCAYSCAVSVYSDEMEPTPMPAGFTDFEPVNLCDVEIGVYVAATHPLASQEAIAPAQLDGVPIAIRMPGTSEEFVQAYADFLSHYGVTPEFDYQAADSDEALIMSKLQKDSVFVIEREAHEGMLVFGDNRLWLPFDPPHYCVCRMMFARDTEKSTLQDFSEFVSARYKQSTAAGE